jgi:hypothetical protein
MMILSFSSVVLVRVRPLLLLMMFIVFASTDNSAIMASNAKNTSTTQSHSPIMDRGHERQVNSCYCNINMDCPIPACMEMPRTRYITSCPIMSNNCQDIYQMRSSNVYFVLRVLGLSVALGPLRIQSFANFVLLHNYRYR